MLLEKNSHPSRAIDKILRMIIIRLLHYLGCPKLIKGVASRKSYGTISESNADYCRRGFDYCPIVQFNLRIPPA